MIAPANAIPYLQVRTLAGPATPTQRDLSLTDSEALVPPPQNNRFSKFIERTHHLAQPADLPPAASRVPNPRDR